MGSTKKSQARNTTGINAPIFRRSFTFLFWFGLVFPLFYLRNFSPFFFPKLKLVMVFLVIRIFLFPHLSIRFLKSVSVIRWYPVLVLQTPFLKAFFKLLRRNFFKRSCEIFLYLKPFHKKIIVLSLFMNMSRNKVTQDLICICKQK